MRRDAATEALAALETVEDAQKGASQPRTAPWLLTFVDLTLQLLAFFVLINALSPYAASRVGPVLDSVESYFGRKGTTPVAAPLDIRRDPITAKDGDVLQPSQFKEHIAGIIARELGITHLSDIRPGEVFVVDVPADMLFTPSGLVHPAQMGLVGRIADALSRRPAGVRYEMEMMLSSATAPGRGNDRVLLVEAGAAAEQFLRMGAPADSLSVGIQQSAPEMMRLQFSIRESDLAPVELTPVDGGAGDGR